MERAARGYVVRTRTPEEILEICEARITLESSATQAAAVHRTQLDLARVVHVHESTAATTDPADLRELNHQWHVALREAGHKATITELMGRLDAQLKVYDSHTAPATDSAEGARSARRTIPAVPTRTAFLVGFPPMSSPVSPA
ncbi:FCD domain-containing protein [Streptomyces samsunensis]|uniref:FCD domain-containing protein n=1 Tax=Streptomyces malaysiensis TaxID=92644 RepID=UPI001582CA79|nr:FCD domain-containing protein [Streptomyces samsunensis]NUH37067.1 FCD domain-containing protein [Streptomyces samsunensis]